MATVTLDEARKAVAQEAKQRNRKIIEQVPQMIANLAKEKTVYIFNVGPTMHQRQLGSLGTFTVPACPEGAEVSPPLKIEGVILERIATDMDKMANRYEEGLDVANDIMFIGRGYTPDLNKENWGLFISETANASKAQIRAAKEKLLKTYGRLVTDADNLERANKRSDIGEINRVAGRALGVVKPWLAETPREAGNCPACQKMIDIETVKCPHCQAILDWDRAKDFYPTEYNAWKAAQAK